MSAAVKLSSKLEGDPQVNGLDAQASELYENPDSIRLGVVWYDVSKREIDTDTDAHVPTVRIRRFEPIGELEDAPQSFRDTVAAAVEKRTGRKPIPFEISSVEEIEPLADPDGDPFPEDD